MTDADWKRLAKGLLRAEMVKHQVSYDDLVQKLAKIGVKDTSANLRNKISRGSFSAVMMLQCLTAIGTSTLRLDEST